MNEEEDLQYNFRVRRRGVDGYENARPVRNRAGQIIEWALDPREHRGFEVKYRHYEVVPDEVHINTEGEEE